MNLSLEPAHVVFLVVIFVTAAIAYTWGRADAEHNRDDEPGFYDTADQVLTALDDFDAANDLPKADDATQTQRAIAVATIFCEPEPAP